MYLMYLNIIELSNLACFRAMKRGEKSSRNWKFDWQLVKSWDNNKRRTKLFSPVTCQTLRLLMAQLSAILFHLVRFFFQHPSTLQNPKKSNQIQENFTKILENGRKIPKNQTAIQKYPEKIQSNPIQSDKSLQMDEKSQKSQSNPEKSPKTIEKSNQIR